MATKIVTKNSSTASAVPTASDLVQGELAVNVADKRLFTEDNGGAIVEVGTNPSTIDINAGTIDGAAIGASSASTGAFTTLTGTQFSSDATDVELKYSGNTKLATTATGIDVTGNMIADGVGIGTSSPSAPLHIKNPNGILVAPTGATTYGVYIQSAFAETMGAVGALSQHDGGRDGASISFGDYGRNLTFNTGEGSSNAEAMRIDSSGRVGIGTSSPSAKLDVAGTVNAYGNSSVALQWGDTSALGSLSFDGSANPVIRSASSKPLVFQTNGANERLRIDSSGNLLVGKSSASSSVVGAQLNANGTLTATVDGARTAILNRLTSDGEIVDFRKGGTIVGSISVTSSATAYNTSSDQRLKENIADADDAGSKIDSIQVRKYDWKADGSHQDYGMVAQELLEVAPEAVSVPEDSEEMMGVDYSKLVPMLIKEIQSLRNRVATLEGN